MKAIASLNQGRLQRRRQVQPDPPLDQAREWSNLYDDGHFVPFGHFDERETLSYAIPPICSIDADVRHSSAICNFRSRIMDYQR
jgi:hypothetical protein